MAYDGITAAAVVSELNHRLPGGIISKIAQPEKDELLLTCKSGRDLVRITISANPSAPLMYIRDDNIQSPPAAPNFCMCLRKHIGGGRIKRIFQPAEDLLHEGLERIIVFEVEHRDEMGEPGIRYLVSELMGKYSNIILLDGSFMIMDSIKHISHMTSSVREVLPGREYFIPNSIPKANPKTIYKDEEEFLGLFRGKTDGKPVFKSLYLTFTGFGPAISSEIIERAGINGERPAAELSVEELKRLYREFAWLMEDVVSGRFEPNIIYEGERPAEISAVRLKSLEGGDCRREDYASISAAIKVYYAQKERQNRLRSKAEDINTILRILTERSSRKLDLLEKQYRDTEKRDKYRIYGELINTWGYSLKGGEKYLECENYYDDGKMVRIPLDDRLGPSENAVRYFNKYQKLKRTRAAVEGQIRECRDTLYHLGSISNSLSLCISDADFSDIRREMSESGYIHKGPQEKRMRREEMRSKPMHFVSSDGIDIYVGRNNYQNEELDFKTAGPNDWWFHAKNIPGSHVIARTGSMELPDSTCLEAAALAAYYSRANAGSEKGAKVEVDYTRRRELKKVPGAAPGFVIYHTNYSIMIEPKGTI